MAAHSNDAEQREDEGNSPPPGHLSRRWLYRWPLLVALVGVLATVGLTLAAAALNSSNEHRLLSLRAKEVAAALASALPPIQTPLASAAALADATDGSRARFQRLISPYVGHTARTPFVSVSLWRLDRLDRGPTAVVGLPPALVPSPTAARFLRQAASRSGLSVIGLLGDPLHRIGYAFSGAAGGPFVAYGEGALPRRRYTTIPPGSAYSDLDFALYLGRSTSPSDLLLRTVRKLPLPGRTARVRVPFGDQELTVLVSPRRALGGSLPQSLPWAIGIVGALLTAGAVMLTAGLARGRRRALGLAEENRQLYAEQRDISQTLQHALLPEALPQLAGVELGARYEAGVKGIDIGGDWYDLIPIDDERLLLVVGDVSGRGLRAATAMAALRFAIHYAAREQPPELFLPKLASVPELRAGGQLATVMCALIHLPTRGITLTNAGHLPPLLVVDGRGEFLRADVGVPLGVDAHPRYRPSTFSAPEGATLLGFTDGLVERRGEVIDEGLERLRRAAVDGRGSLEELIGRVLADVRGGDPGDDTVVAGIRWLS